METAADRRRRRRNVVSITLFILVACVDAVDLAVLPATFREIKAEFDLGQTALASTVFVRGIAQALSAFIGGALGQRFDRPLVICLGCWIWGLGTLGVGVSPSFGVLLAAVAINGIGLGIIKPVIVSLIADLAPPSQMGRMFSVYDCVGSVATIVGAAAATVVAPIPVPFAPALGNSWRLIFIGLALCAALLGAFVALCAAEPRRRGGGGLGGRSVVASRGRRKRNRNKGDMVEMEVSGEAASGEAEPAVESRCAACCRGIREMVRETIDAFRAVGRIPTFWVIIGQGGFGSMPWQSIGFLTLYFELGCYSNVIAATLNGVFRGGCAIGALVGGCVGDALDKRSPNHGRPCTALISVGSGLPFTFVLLILMAPLLGDTQASVAFGAILFAMGLFVTWCAAQNRSVFATVVKPHLRPTIYAFDAVLEGCMGSFGSLSAGVLADALMKTVSF